MTLTSNDIQRYARHLPLIGREGQAHLFAARILCVGAGGLGASVLQYLAAAGIGTIGIVDGDQVELSNLQRQVIFSPEDIGKNKALVASRYLSRFNPSLKTIVREEFLNEDNATKILKDFELVIDCSDNYRTRYLLNDICIQLKKPLISASIYQFQGQCSVFNYKEGPCYRCLYEEPPPEELIPNCALGGVLGVLPGILGCIQATEALKIILDKGEVLSGRLLTIDALSMRTREFRVPKNPQCPCCYEGKSALDLFLNTDNSKKIREIEAQKLAQWLENQNDNLLLIDVREPYEREICHIGGQHIPLRELDSRQANLPRNKFIICYCKSGQRSRRAVQLLMDNGFTNVSSLQGGIMAWISSIDHSLTKY
ncbi:molybdopterin-synthase adenylyltransferase MoeB [Coxiella burnetii]|uniref:molybdopterin-synthase adenylyltransferase MoeB n=1 Tax=Coxiella burnetii TaxID=777 RepID=UPI000592F596|nr:molybdopterin-synthase adenylyltransferase MoeB [Coxiella burnetii]ATN74304.1 thiamine biosynthesis protein ThiF [Coxiella burnetii]ATN76209.1 thiamine biosynthesis protein ThiF [Coxiella burnetii]ATN78124.1 thiamine biosynthesis protein ThiF [Coxiella burnetii]ATN80039.1 thiamine biosynthesis protein ThiF [Coxiella burnetii]OYK91221.1 thiamine biosynthesis protein ThiF [Coxiella burnetii]